jgi:hypothetical protein
MSNKMSKEEFMKRYLKDKKRKEDEKKRIINDYGYDHVMKCTSKRR